MDQILLPMLALGGWTFLVLLQIPFRRFRAGFRGQVTAEDFRYGESQRVPPEVSIPNRNLMNLLEMPILFYVVSIALYVTHHVGQGALVLAWVYVGLRLLHSWEHLTTNYVPRRLVAFALSNFVLVSLWVSFIRAVF